MPQYAVRIPDSEHLQIGAKDFRGDAIAFMDEATPTSKAKPDGVMGAEIWVKCGDAPPTDPSQCGFLDTKTPYVAESPGTDGGKVAHYMLRWVNTRGEKGPWSETVSATIGA